MSLVTSVFHFMFKTQYRHIRKPKTSFYPGTGVLQTTRKGRTNQRRYVLKWNKPWFWAHTPGALERVHTRASSIAINKVSIAFQILFGLSMDPHVKWQMIWTSSLQTAPVNVKSANCKPSFFVSSVIVSLSWRSLATLRHNLSVCNCGQAFRFFALQLPTSKCW